MEENQSQIEIPELSKKYKEIIDINDSQEHQNKETNPLNITNDLIPTVSLILY